MNHESAPGTGLAIPDPNEQLTLFDFDALYGQVVAWAPTVDDVGVLHDERAKLGALDAYLERKSMEEGRAAVVNAMREVDLRIAELIGPGEPGNPNLKPQVAPIAPRARDLPRRLRTDVRKMKAHEETTRAVMAGATDASPASTRKVMKTISDAAPPGPAAAKPDVVPLTLPVPAAQYERLNARAGTLGMTTVAYGLAMMLKGLGPLPGAQTAATPAKPNCKHTNRRIISGGLAYCDECNSKRTSSGKWVPR